MARLVLVHYVVDHLAHLLLVGLEHLHLALHELGLAVHERLRDHIHILRLHELLPHLVQEGVHFIVGDLLQIRLMVLDCGGHIGLLRSEALVQGLCSRRPVDFPELQNWLVVVKLFILFDCDDFGLRGEVTLRSGVDESFCSARHGERHRVLVEALLQEHLFLCQGIPVNDHVVLRGLRALCCISYR